jgi:hypothetical protein
MSMGRTPGDRDCVGERALGSAGEERAEAIGVRRPAEGEDARRLSAPVRTRLLSDSSSDPGLSGRFNDPDLVAGEDA